MGSEQAEATPRPSSSPNPSVGCRRNTDFACKDGATNNSEGLAHCYDKDEVCIQSSDGVLECFCKPGFCLEGSGATVTCHNPGAQVSVAHPLAPNLLLFV